MFENLSTEAEQPAEPSLAERLSDATSSSSALAEKQKAKDMTRDIVTREIEALKKKLESRKKIFPHEIDPALNKAKEDVVTCLRLNDRRPLDCWQEVENFKTAVDRQAKEFVEKTII
jgi:altered-inheritance-of-mitochondria protein 13